MLCRFSVRVCAVVVLMTLAAAPMMRADAQRSGTPDVTADLPAGISMQTLASGQPNQFPASAPLILEHLTFSPGSSTGMRQTGGPELLYVESGNLVAEDNLGLRSPLATGARALLEQDAIYAVRNESSVAATLFRLRIAEATPASTTDRASTPSGADTADVSAAPEISIVARGEASELPPKPATIFLARATYAPDSDSGIHTHSGPVGFVVESGTLSIGSSSGLTGQLPSGQSIVLPKDTAHHEGNQNQEPVSALVFGVVVAGQPLDVTAAPTVVATAPPEAPEQVQSNSQDTPPGTILPLGQAWRSGDAVLTLDAQCCDFQLILTFTNAGKTRTDFVVPSGLLQVFDDNGETWLPPLTHRDDTSERLILEPGAERQFGFYFSMPNGQGARYYSANVFVEVAQFGEIHGAMWGFTFIEGDILPLPPGTQDPRQGSFTTDGTGLTAMNRE